MTRVALPFAFLLVACQAAPMPGAACTRASDCPAPLTCSYGRCRTECQEARDCPLGTRCLAAAGSGICSLDVEDHCTSQNCPMPLTCVNDRCRTHCTGPTDCLAGVCDGTTCVEPISGIDAGVPIDASTPIDTSVPVDMSVPVDASTPLDAFVAADTASPDAVLYDAGPGCASSACVNRVLFSEILPAGATGYFLELYNRGPGNADLSDCGILAENGAGAPSMFPLPTGTIVAERGYLLLGDASIAGADIQPPTMFAVTSVNGSVQLSCPATGGTPIDSVGWGSGAVLHDGTPLGTWPTGHSFERKARSTSTSASMGPGGTDEFAGNGYSSGDNATDFVDRVTPQPQSSRSPLEPP